MGASATPRPAESAGSDALAVAASGGRDSTALLHATCRAAQVAGLQVHALHVHHGLQPAADGWVAHVRGQCRRWGARFHLARLTGQPAPGESIEAWARRERYAALGAMARAAGCRHVLLAQHRRDQAETVLLQLLRGAGARGLAAMPARAERDGITWHRPWREQPREAIESYLRQHRLRFVDDPSNADARLARNRIRLAVWPALAQAFPQAEAALATAARRAADEAQALRELAAMDAAAVREGDALVKAAWLLLSPARRVLQLREAIGSWAGQGAPETLVQRLADELPRCPSGQWPAPGGQLQLRRGRLRFVPAATD